MKRFITENEIACMDKLNAESIMESLIEEGYVVMLSKEEQLYIVNYIWSEHNADRNDVIFVGREEYDDEEVESEVENKTTNSFWLN